MGAEQKMIKAGLYNSLVQKIDIGFFRYWNGTGVQGSVAFLAQLDLQPLLLSRLLSFQS